MEPNGSTAQLVIPSESKPAAPRLQALIDQAPDRFLDHFDLDHIKDKIAKGMRAAKAVTSAWVGAGADRKNLVYKRLAERVKA